MTASDAELWQRAQRSDDRAFGDLFARHHPRVFRQALRLVVLPADADDVSAAAFFELWRRREDVPLVDGSVLPWLLATCALLARNRVRGGLRYQRVLHRMPRDRVLDAAETATDRLEARERRRRIAAALRQVSPADAALVVLTAVEGLPVADAALAVGVPPAAARMRLSRARGRLRTLLADLHAEQGSDGTSEEGRR